jgi:starch phosphorylase
MDWEPAWDVTVRTFAYTNHTLLPEALEKWPVELFGGMLPRHLEIVYEINHRFLEEVQRRYPDDGGRAARLSLIDEHHGRYVRMAHLACVGSHAINGVAALHTELLTRDTLRDFHELWPDKFSNKTNGVTPRRFLALANPDLAGLIGTVVGDGWVGDLMELRKLEAVAGDAGFQDEWRRVKRAARLYLARLLRLSSGVTVDPDSMFDIQAKRIHEYKRQHLNVLHVIALYNRIRRHPAADQTPRTIVFAGKAAPAYFMAKLIIKLINEVARVVNADPAAEGLLKVAFLPNFNVKSGQVIYPAADLSEQISTAGKEASGTGNMKFAMNGALTIGTLDGANIEIRQEVGEDNFFLFGLTAEQVARSKSDGYSPRDLYLQNESLREAIDQVRGGYFSRGDTELFRPLVDSLLYHDEYMVLADFASYIECQRQAGDLFRDRSRWTRASILNVARIGKFSSDRAIREYCDSIWNVVPVAVDVESDVAVTASTRDNRPY